MGKLKGINTKPWRLIQKRLPFIKFGTKPDNMNPLGFRCPNRCKHKIANECMAQFCRRDLRKARKLGIRMLRTELDMLLENR